MSFTDQKPFTVTEHDTSSLWRGQRPWELFRCAWCGHKFEVGDTARWVYTNGNECDISIAGNPFICTACDGPREAILAKLLAMAKEADGRMWWFCRHESSD